MKRRSVWIGQRRRLVSLHKRPRRHREDTAASAAGIDGDPHRAGAYPLDIDCRCLAHGRDTSHRFHLVRFGDSGRVAAVLLDVHQFQKRIESIGYRCSDIEVET